MSDKDAVDEVADGLEVAADRLDEIGASLKGIHAGIAEMHQSLSAQIGELAQAVQGLSANARTGLSTIPGINKRLRVVEEILCIEPEEPQPNGAATPQ